MGAVSTRTALWLLTLQVEPLVRLAKENLGYVYYLVSKQKSSTAACQPLPSQPINALLRPCFLAAATHLQVGIHSDMIKRSNDKLSQQRLDQLKEAALRPEALALLTGLDFSRDMGIR